MGSLTMSADGRKLDAQILAKIAEVRKLEAQMSGLQMDANSTKLALKIAQKEAEAKRLEEQLHDMDMDADVSVLEAKFNAVHAELALLKRDASDIDLVMNNVAALRNIGVAKAELATLQSQAKDLQLGTNIDPAKLVAAEAALLGIEHVVEGLGKKDLPEANTAMGAFFRSTKAGSTAAAAGWRLLTGHITLMGGALNSVLPKMFTSVAVWHLLADAVIEILAVWTPAIIAVTAFGVAGADAGKAIYNRMQAVHTVMDATGRAVPPLNNNFKKLANSVRPEVYQLFGDALVVMAKRGSAFNQVAIGTGRVLDQLAARFVVAITNGGGVNKFMEHAVEDVAKLGDSIGNFGGIFGAVFRAVPGYAEILLKVGDWMTKVIEAFTQAAEPIIAVGLALHGFFIYGGAAVTLTFALVAGLVKVLGAFGKFNEAITLVGFNALKKFGLAVAGAIANIITYTGAIISMAVSDGIATAATALLSDAMLVLSRVPVAVWITIAAVALTSLAIAIGRSKDEAQRFNGTMQDLVKNASLSNVVTTIQSAQAATSARLASTTRDLNKAVRENKVVFAGRAGALNSNGTAIQNLGNSQRHYTEGLAQLTDQQKLVNTRFGILSKTYGGNAQALGILNAAGITTAQMTDKSASAWAIIQVQVEATTRAYKAMGTQTGVLGNDLDVIGRTLTDQYQAVQKLNQAWGSFISDVTGTQTSFDTVAQGFFTLNDHAGKLTFTLGKLKVKYADQKAAIDSLTPAGIALNQAFSDQVGNLDKLFASWRTAGVAGNLFTQGVAAAVAPLEKYARGSQEATAQLVALGQEAGYQGPVSLSALNKYLSISQGMLKDTAGSTQKLKDVTNQATTQEALLTGAMQSQGSFIVNQLLGDIDQAALKYYGVSKAVTAYGTAVAESGKGSDKANKKMTAAILAIVQAEQRIGDNTSQMAAVVSKTFGVSMPAAMKLVQAALVSTVSGVKGAQGTFERFAIKGLKMTSDQARWLWTKFSESNLGALATKADTTRGAFDKLASKGLGITRDQADKLWIELRRQYLDALAVKGDITRDKFIKLATQGLDLTRTAAQKLWDTLHRQQLTDAANKAGETKGQFEHLANQLGVTKGYADRLWDSLHKVASGSPYSVKIVERGDGTFSINGGRVLARAAGGYIDMGSGPTADDVPVMASRGEYVVKAASVAKYGKGTMDAINAGAFAGGGPVGRFASGGLVPDGGLNSLAGATTNFHADFYNAMTDAMKAAMTRALKAAQATAAAASSGGVSGAGPVGGDAAANKALARRMFPWNIYTQWGAFDTLEMHEAGYNRFARNPSSGAYGIPQAYPPTKMPFAAQAAGGSHAGPQLSWMFNYIRQVYGTPAAAWAQYYNHAGGVGSYASGGLVGMAAAGLRSRLAVEQGLERAKYYGLGHAFATGPAKYRTKTVLGELATLAKRQRAEQAAYSALSGSGLTTSALHHLGATARAEIRTAADKGLSKMPGGHPGFAADLRRYLGQISATASGTVPAGSTAGGGSSGGGGSTGGGSKGTSLTGGQIASQGRAYLTAWQTKHGGGYGAAWGPVVINEQIPRMQAALNRARTLAKAPGLTAKQHKHYAALAADDARRLAVLKRELAIERSWRGQLGASDTALTADIRAAGATPSLAKNIRAWQSQITRQKGTISAISKMLGYSDVKIAADIAAAEKAGKLGPGGTPLPSITHTYGAILDSIETYLMSHSAPFTGMARGGLVKSFDNGGTLAPGPNFMWNGTGKNEHLVPAGGNVTVTLQIAPGGGSEFDRFMTGWMRKHVHVKGGGSVERAFGTH